LYPRSDPSWILVLLLSLVLFLSGLGAYPLLDPDEGRNALVALEMVRDGHWLPPTLEGQVRYQKPPLYYWMVAGTFMALGPGETQARLPSALAALAGIILVFFLGEALWGREKGFLAAVFASTSLIYVAYAHIVIFDMVLTLFILAILLFSWKGLEEDKKGAWVLASFFAALAFLTKGPVGILIPIMALLPLILYRVLIGKEKISLPIPLMIGVFLVVAVPPFLLAEMRNPGYCYQFFWKENVVRYLSPVFRRQAPFYYYLVVTLLGFMPWTLFLPRLIRKLGNLWRLFPHRTIFLLSWILLPTLFFSLSKAKMPHYILPLFPAWALILAGAWGEGGPSFKLLSALVALYIALFLVAMPIYSEKKSAAFAVPLIIQSEKTPIFTYKAGRAYSFIFYTGEKVRKIQSLEELERDLGSTTRAYILTKKKKLEIPKDLPGYSARILGSNPKYTLVLVEKPLPGSSKPQAP